MISRLDQRKMEQTTGGLSFLAPLDLLRNVLTEIRKQCVRFTSGSQTPGLCVLFSAFPMGPLPNLTYLWAFSDVAQPPRRLSCPIHFLWNHRIGRSPIFQAIKED